MLAGSDVVAIRAPGQEERFTTVGRLRLERELLGLADDRREERLACARPELVEEALARRALSDEQAELVRALTCGPGGVQVVRAPAGAGKTFVLDAAREAWTRSDVRVIGCALSARAAAELRGQAATDTTTIARLKRSLDHGRPLPAYGVLVVDEAGMVGTADLHRLASSSREVHTRIVLVGDDRQLPEIQAGGAFRALAERHGQTGLREVRRQRHDWDRRALAALRNGEPATWAQAYTDAGRVVTASSATEVRERLAADRWHAHRQGADALMIAARRSDVADLNQRARDRMRVAERLRGDDVELGRRSFAAGDRVVLGRNDRRLGVVNGDRDHIITLTADRVTVRLDRGADVQLPAG